MLGFSDVVLAPWRAGQLVLRAADDLNAIAERARRDPDPVEEVRERLDALLFEIRALIATARTVDGTGQQIVVGGQDLVAAARTLDVDTRELIAGGRDLNDSAKTLDAHSVELINGGSDLTAVSEHLAAHLEVFRSALPRLLEALDTVEQLENAVETVADTVEPLAGAVETVAETVEPLAGAAEGVGRLTQRLSRRPKGAPAPGPARVRSGG